MTHKIISTISNHEPRRDASIYDQTFLFLFKPTFFSFTAKKSTSRFKHIRNSIRLAEGAKRGKNINSGWNGRSRKSFFHV